MFLICLCYYVLFYYGYEDDMVPYMILDNVLVMRIYVLCTIMLMILIYARLESDTRDMVE